MVSARHRFSVRKSRDFLLRARKTRGKALEWFVEVNPQVKTFQCAVILPKKALFQSGAHRNWLKRRVLEWFQTQFVFEQLHQRIVVLRPLPSTAKATAQQDWPTLRRLLEKDGSQLQDSLHLDSVK
jgi:RNase P protein component